MTQQIDWPGIRTNAVTLGIRGAARAATSHLPHYERDRFVERVMKRAQREGWETQRREVMMSAGLSAMSSKAGAPPLPLSANVRNGAESQSIVNAENSLRGRSALLKYGADAAEDAAALPRGERLLNAPLVASIAKTLSTAGDWAAQDSAPRLTLNLWSVGGEMGVEREMTKTYDVEPRPAQDSTE